MFHLRTLDLHAAYLKIHLLAVLELSMIDIFDVHRGNNNGNKGAKLGWVVIATQDSL